MLLRSVAVALRSLALSAVGAARHNAMSLKEAVESRSRPTRRLGPVSNDRRAIDEELRQGRALYLPQVDLRAATGPEFSDNVTIKAAATRQHHAAGARKVRLP